MVLEVEGVGLVDLLDIESKYLKAGRIFDVLAPWVGLEIGVKDTE